jgi:uncharacterized damage-inducible protein DinB
MNGAALLPEFDHEMANTRKTLERVPDDQLEFKPHEKSYSLLQLAGHIGNIPSWTEVTLTTEGLDIDGPFERDEPTSRDEVLAEFDRNVAGARSILEPASGEEMTSPWTLKMGGQEAFTMPRGSVFRLWILNHAVHHRAQLTVYFRLLGIPVPALYGPSADEQE